MINNYYLKSMTYKNRGRARLSKCQGDWRILAISVNYENRSKAPLLGVQRGMRRPSALDFKRSGSRINGLIKLPGR